MWHRNVLSVLVAVVGALLLTGGSMAGELKEAVFAGGCFWCMESPFDKVSGVVATTSGYTGGHLAKPSYEAVSSGTSGHYEAIRISYDPAMVSYEDLLRVFWKNVDPFDDGGQFCDRGPQYRAAIFAADEAERAAAKKSAREVETSKGQQVRTMILPRGEFFPAEEYHQDYYQRNPIRYHYYRTGCGGTGDSIRFGEMSTSLFRGSEH